MNISNAQISTMNELMLIAFAQQSVRNLETEFPDWKSEGTAWERELYVVSFLKYAISLGLQAKDQLYRFVVLVLKYTLTIPLPAEFLQEFKRRDITPAGQLENLLLRLLSGRDKKKEIQLY